MKGMYIYCNGCKAAYSNDAKISCNCKNYAYKAKIHVPGTKRECRTKILKAQNYKDAVKERLMFEEELVSSKFEKKIIKLAGQETIGPPVLLLDCIDAYLAFLNDIDVPEHEIKDISKKTIADFKRFFGYTTLVLTKKGFDITKYKFAELDSSIVGLCAVFLTEELEYKNKTFNNYMTSMATFCNYISKNYYREFRNPFSNVRRRVANKSLSINIDEFFKLMELVKPENGFKKEKHKTLNIYRPWLKSAFLLALFTGGRNEEIVSMKWNKIVFDEDNGEMLYIEVPDYKVSRIQGRILSEEDYKMKKVVITSEFKDLLYSLGFEIYGNTAEYILAPLETLSREGMKNLTSTAFSHFFKQIEGQQVLKTLKHLRKTYSTAAKKQYGDLAYLVSNHDGMGTLNGHYVDHHAIIKDATKNFSVLGKGVSNLIENNINKSTQNDEDDKKESEKE